MNRGSRDGAVRSVPAVCGADFRVQADACRKAWVAVCSIAMSYFSEREKGPKPRTVEEITPAAWKGLWAIINTRLQNGSFGNAFPDQCPDGRGVVGHDPGLLEATAQGHGIVWPINPDELPDTLDVMDLLEFCDDNVAKPVEAGYHSFFGHSHLSFDVDEGQAAFRKDLNTMLARNGIAFEMNDDGIMVRLGPGELIEDLRSATFKTGDDQLDEFLEDAREKYTSPNVKTRKEALEEIWDAFERLKTIEGGKDKKAAVTTLLQKGVADADLRARVDKEMQELTEIGNTFMIRHTEVGKKPITKSEQVDYLFQRMFAVVRLLLKGTNRGG